MIKLFRILFTLLFSIAFLYATENRVTFGDLENGLHVPYEEKVRIRGFLYQHPNGSLILASQPNLKSCCIGTKANLRQQLLVYGSSQLEPSSYVAHLEGILKQEPRYNEKGELIQLYVLEEAQIIPDNAYPLWIVAGIAIALLVLFYCLLFKKEAIKR